MMIEKVDLNAEVNAFIEKEQEKHEIENGVICNYSPFCFVSKINGTVIGAITGATFYSEIYIDELVVKKIYRRKGIGTQLINKVEIFYKGQGFDNINCCTNEFQASGFYEKCGFKLEFVRKNKFNPKLNKYFYIKYLD